MAYNPDVQAGQEEEDERLRGNSDPFSVLNQSMSAPGTGGGASAGAGSGMTPATNSSPAQGPSNTPNEGSGRFVNFQKIFDQNYGAANDYANQLAGDAQNKANAAREQVNTTTQNFNDAVTNGGRGQLQTDYTRPSGNQRPRYVGDMGQASYTQNGYQGPNSYTEFADLSALNDSIVGAQSNLNSLGSYEGVQGAIQARAQGPYTQGQSRFDAALIGGAGQDRFANLRNQFSDLGSAVTNAATAGNARIQSARSGQDAAYNERQAQDKARLEQDAYEYNGRSDAEYQNWLKEQRKARADDMADYGRGPRKKSP